MKILTEFPYNLIVMFTLFLLTLLGGLALKRKGNEKSERPKKRKKLTSNPVPVDTAGTTTTTAASAKVTLENKSGKKARSSGWKKWVIIIITMAFINLMLYASSPDLYKWLVIQPLYWIFHAIVLIVAFVTELGSDTGNEATKWIKGAFIFCLLLAIGTWGYRKYGLPTSGADSWDDSNVRTITVTSHWGKTFIPPHEWAGRHMDWTPADTSLPFQVATQSDTVTYHSGEKYKDIGTILSLNFRMVSDTTAKFIVRAYK
ncbi:MAG: hypothetical protein JWL80_306 [Parcubacteria group bacterium]|nr:hypothetical protein [Parcubacteria group bacterium]